MTAPAPTTGENRWCSPLTGQPYDRSPVLRDAERGAIERLGLRNLRRLRYHDPLAPQWTAIRRLTAPLDQINRSLDVPSGAEHLKRGRDDATAVLLLRCARMGRTYWDWSSQEWLDLLGRDHTEFCRGLPRWAGEYAVRPFLCAYAFHLGNFGDFHLLGKFDRSVLAGRIFGRALVAAQVDKVRSVLTGWGYQYGQDHDKTIPATAGQLFLLNRSPYLDDLSTDVFARAREESLSTEHGRRGLYPLQRAVAELGYCEPPPTSSHRGIGRATGVPPSWARWVERWFETSTLTRGARKGHRTNLLKAGRWLAAEHPDVTEPATWTRRTCAAWVAAVDRMQVGDYVARTVSRASAGQPLRAQTKDAHLSAARAFFRDCQEWEWIPRRFSVQHALATPTSVAALIGPSPRVIADDVWAKLLGAGLNLDTDDLTTARSGTTYYPLELVRAITLTWLFAGLRSDEIARLRLGCIRWQHEHAGETGEAKQAVCLLDVPPHKTGTAFTKPVDPLLGQAIEAWQALRPEQPPRTDRRTGQQAHYLFSFRARPMSISYINHSVIPMLCRKAGVPPADVRGKITSHRARSTIASQLFNAKEPMTLFELQAWLGHRSPESTQFYAKISPHTLTRAYKDAGYFARNMRTIEVLLDRDAVASGAAAAGEPWQYYDLGHGLCSYTFFEQCPHRMACARCDFYTPKSSSKAQLLEAKENLSKMLATIPLTEQEQAAVEDGQEALERLVNRLADTPTPSGQLPRQQAASGRSLPVLPTRHGGCPHC